MHNDKNWLQTDRNIGHEIEALFHFFTENYILHRRYANAIASHLKNNDAKD